MSEIGDKGLDSGDSGRVRDGGVPLGGIPCAKESALPGDSKKVVEARGTEEGLVLRIDGKADWSRVIRSLEDFLGNKQKFFEGAEINVEWLECLPTKEQSKELEKFLLEGYGISIVARPRLSSRIRRGFGVFKDGGKSRSKRERVKTIHLSDDVVSVEKSGDSSDREEDAGSSKQSAVYRATLDPLTARELSGGLFEESVDEGFKKDGRDYLTRIAKYLDGDACFEEGANARVHFGTLRSGQKVETPFSLVVIGDVNPGADLVAGGDIVVFGGLRGTAHASAYDEDDPSGIILALHMRPIQLRIGAVISRGSDEVVSGAEVARMDNRQIVVEPFNPRAFFSRTTRAWAT